MPVPNMGFFVSVVDYAFLPSKLNLIAGDWIIFENRGKTLHKIVGDIPESPELIPAPDLYSYGQMWTVKFDKPGEFNVSCSHYPNMFFTCKVLPNEGQVNEVF